MILSLDMLEEELIGLPLTQDVEIEICQALVLIITDQDVVPTEEVPEEVTVVELLILEALDAGEIVLV
jgi:hypothetical protein